MAHVKFQHVFAALLVLSALSAFVLGPRLTDASRAAVQGIFAPVSRPTHVFAGWIGEHVAGPRADDNGPGGKPRSDAEIAEENAMLRETVAHLTSKLADLEQLNAEMETLGDVRKLCIRVKVIGADAGARQSISLQGTSLAGLRKGQPVLSFGQNVVGLVDRVNVGGSQVRLITDSSFAVIGRFGRFVRTNDPKKPVEFVHIATPQPLAVGSGRGTMVVRSLSVKDVEAAELREGDWLVVDDPDWPLQLQGFKLGRVSKIEPQPASPLHAEIMVAPHGDLMKLRDVMVMTKG